MKAISIRQPWAYAIFYLGKDIENRTWRTAYRGPLLIHASKRWSTYGHSWLVSHMRLDVPHRDKHVLGAIIGMVDLVGCISFSGSRWFQGPYGWVLKSPLLFEEPVPYRGMPGLFDVPKLRASVSSGGRP